MSADQPSISVDLLVAAMEKADEAIFVVDQNANILYTNTISATRLGMSKEELQKMKIHDIDPGYPKHYWPTHWQDLRTNRTSTVVTKHQRKDGSLFPVEIKVNFIEHSDQEYVVAFARDITERLKQEERAEQANRLRREFLAVVSHELRTPLNAICGIAHLLQDDKNEKNESEQKELLNTLSTASSSLLSLINDILDFSKIDAQKMSIEQRPFSLYETIADCLDKTAQKYQNKPIHFSFEADPTLQSQQQIGDQHRIQQVVFNLVDNAGKYTHTGFVNVGLHIIQQQYYLTVRDTGIGIRPDRLPVIFEPFVSDDGSSSKKFGGTGLGLAICKKIIEKMGGMITASNHPQGGALFSVILPLSQATQPETPSNLDVVASQKQQDQRFFSQLRILLVEDNIVNQKIAAKILKNFGCDVVVASSGQEALDFWQKSKMGENARCDLVLMDIQMPDMDGYETTKALRQNQNVPQNLPIVALTANAFAEDRQRCLDSGMDDYLTKPIAPERLRHVLRLWTERQ